MPQRLYTASPSKLTTYLDCPRRYRLQYLDVPRPPSGPRWAHNSVGAAVHATLLRWWDLPEDKRTPEAGGALLVGGWSDQGFRDAEQSLQSRERAREYVEAYLATVDPVEEPLGRERTVAVRTQHAALSGRADRIDDRPVEGLVVVDYKTGRRPLTIDDARGSLALAIYAAGASVVFRRPCSRVELHHLPSGEVIEWEYTAEALERQIRRADDLAGELTALDDTFRSGLSPADADELFPANVGPLCGWCDFREACPAGSVVPRQEPWAGI
jgi:RecB family exonuclease